MNHRWRTVLVLAVLAAIGLSRPGSAACPDFVLLSTTDYGVPTGGSVPWALAVDGSGNVFVAGWETVSGGWLDWRIRKYDASLTTLLASTDYNGPGDGEDEAFALALDGSGNVLVAGYEDGSTGGHNWRIRKYNASLSVLLATTSYDGPAGNNDQAWALAADGSGNVFVAGDEVSPAGGMNWRIRKYNASLTTLLATTDYNGPANVADGATALALDGTGNVLVAGVETGVVGIANWRVRKYNASLTALLGTTDYNGPASMFDYPTTVAVDGTGNVLVAGCETASGPQFKWRIRRYNASLTGLLATTDYSGPTFGDDEARSLAVDGAGNVLVAGWGGTASSSDDWEIRKYDASLATLLAATNYDGPADGYDGAMSIVVDGAGNVLVAGSETGLSGDGNWRIRKYGQPVCLDAAIAFSRTNVSVGQWITVTLTVSNAGGKLLNGIPALWADAGPGTGTIVTGPVPTSTAMIATGGAAKFAWTFSASGAGAVELTGTLTGWDVALSATVWASASGLIMIQRPPALSSGLAVAPSAVFPGEAVTLVYTVSNSGEAGATVIPHLPRASGAATAYVALGPSPAFILGGGQTSFTWVLTAGPAAGTATFTVSASGVDVNSLGWVPVPQAAAGPVTVVIPAAPCQPAGNLVAWYDGRALGYDRDHGIVVMPSGSIFIATEEDREDISHQTDVLLMGYLPVTGGLYWTAEYYAPSSVPEAAYAVARSSIDELYAVGRAGNTAWIAKYFDPGGSDWTLLPVAPPGGPDEARGVAVDPSGSVVIVGTQNRSDLGHGNDVWVAKYDAAGGPVWSVNYDSPAHGDDRAYGVAVDQLGCVYVAGYETRTDVAQGQNIILLKYAPDGTLIMTRSYTSPGANADEAWAVAVDEAGAIYVAGFETRPDLGQGENGWVRKYDGAGVVKLTLTFNSPMVRPGGPNDRALGIAVDGVNGDIYVTGREERPGQAANLILRRWDAAGKPLDVKSRNGPNSGDDEGDGISIGPDGDLYVVGTEDWNNIAMHTNGVVWRYERPGCLKAAISVSPARVGAWFEVVLTVTNTGTDPMTGILPALATGPGTGLVSLIAGPVPASVGSLGAGAAASFTWTFSASGAGVLGVTGTGTGTESSSGMLMTAWANTGIEIQPSALLVGAISAPPSTCPGSLFDVTVTVTNTGGAPVLLVSAPLVVAGAAAALVAGPVPPFPLTVAGGASVSLVWTWSTEGSGAVGFTVTVEGVEVNSGVAVSTGPLAAGTAAGLSAVLTAASGAPSLAAVGTWMTVSLTVTNTGLLPATGVMPVVSVGPGGGAVVPKTGPSPPGPVAIPPGGAQTFSWTFSASGAGSVTFTMTAAGLVACGPARASATAVVQLGNPAALVGKVVSAAVSPVCVGASIEIVVSVTNTGDAAVLGVAGTTTLFIDGGGTASLAAAPPPVASLAPAGSAHFTWRYLTTGPGTIRFTATVAGTDAVWGWPVRTAPLTTPATVVNLPAVLATAAAIPPSGIIGQWITVALTVTNTGGRDATGVTAAAYAGPGAGWIAGPSPPGPLVLPPAGSQTFNWTFSVSGAGALAFSFSVSGTTCGGGLAVAGTAAGVVTGLRPARLSVDGLTLAPAGAQVGAAVTATLVLRNSGDATVTVASLSRTVAGAGGLGSPGLPSPALPVAIAGGTTATITWTHLTSTPCGTARDEVMAAGAEAGSGRFLSAAVASNWVTLTGTPTGFSASAPVTQAFVGTPVVLTAVVTDSCGVALSGVNVAFTVTAGGGFISAASATTNSAGRVTVTLTLGLNEGRNAVRVAVNGTPLVVFVTVDGINPLLLTDPGAALDRNILVLNTGEVVLARIWPTTEDPVVTRIFTASGRLVRTLRNMSPMGHGQFLVQWDGRSEDEFPVARGVYLVQVRGGGISQILKVLVK